MKLFYAAASPFVRKVMVVAHETGLAASIETVSSTAHPVNRNAEIVASNPLGQVPTLILDDGTILADSRVICEYLDHAGKGSLFPQAGPLRWQALRDQSMADGLMSAAVLGRYETLARAPEHYSQSFHDGQMAKIASVLSYIEVSAKDFGSRVDIGTIAVACALSYLDLRYGGLDWRKTCPGAADWYADFSQRPAMQATALKG